MGSPLGPTLANFFMAHLEQKFFSDNVNDQKQKYLFFQAIYINTQ